MSETEKCPDCGRELTESHDAFGDQWDPGRPELCYPYVNFGGSQLCAERMAERLRIENAELRAEVAKLEGLFQQTHGCHWSWVHKVTSLQSERDALQACVAASDTYIDELQYDRANNHADLSDTRAARDTWDAARAKVGPILDALRSGEPRADGE